MNNRQAYFPVVFFFISVNTLLIVLHKRVDALGIDRDVLMAGNFFLFLITIISLIVIMRGLTQVKTLSFVRSINTAFISKFFLVVAAVVIYALAAKEINNGAVLVSMGLYLIYTALEVRILLTQMKRKPDGEEGSPD